MILARVVDTVVSTVKHPHLQGYAVFVVQPITPEGADDGDTVLAVDHAQSGPGDTVLMLCEGNGIRQILRNPGSCVRRLIVAVVDQIETGAA